MQKGEAAISNGITLHIWHQIDRFTEKLQPSYNIQT